MSNSPSGSVLNRPPSVTPMEMWGGIESTVNRVGDHYFDQVERTGHDTRTDDLELFAELGIQAIRYPVLWERIAPNGIKQADWNWPDARLHRLRDLDIRPIVGLLHHGSGPRHTSLIDPSFPDLFAIYAAAVAQRYPWVEDYTPINEPLTTARFSGLYGHWYPHERNDHTFARALIHQCRGVILAMRAIRKVNPAARLIQTEDPGKAHSTAALAYQVDFENERRWLTFDLLSGSLTKDRPLWQWLLASGIAEDELTWFLDNPCPPDMLGVDYYLSSERFLDERLNLYPGELVGTNGTHVYVDVCASRVLPEGIKGIHSLLTEAWNRYHIPICMTEAHNGSTREEQLRWLHEVWQEALQVRDQGVDVKAVTAWSLLGSYDWPSLVTREDGIYEPGVFDIRSPQPRPTALAHMTHALATSGTYSHPVLEVPGWWRRSDRFIYKDSLETLAAMPNSTRHLQVTASRILIVGDDSFLALALADACQKRYIPYSTMSEQDLPDLERHIKSLSAWAVLLAFPYRDTPAFPGVLANQISKLMAQLDLPLVAFSSDAVFDGMSDVPYMESSSVSNANEDLLLTTHPGSLIVRTGPLFGLAAEGGMSIDSCCNSYAPGDIVSPTYAPDFADVVIDLLLDQAGGIWHVSNSGTTAWETFRMALHEQSDIPEKPCEPEPGQQQSCMRALTSERGWFLPDWRTAMHRIAGQDSDTTSDEMRRLASDD